MNREYIRNSKIVIYGSAKTIDGAFAVLDTLEGIEGNIAGYRLQNEGEIRLILQDAIDAHNIKAAILVDGNTVYPYKRIVREYEQLEKSGRLDAMSDAFYKFLHLNFDIAHYSKSGYIAYYGNDFTEMKKAVLDRASVPGWHTDLRRILDRIQGLSVREALPA
jgi:hypothetical protein